MTIRFQETDSFDTKVAKIEAWYDRHTRLWCIQKLNAEGYQIGDADWCYGKADKNQTVAELKAEYNLT